MTAPRTADAFVPVPREWHGAHHPWSYSPRAFIWDGQLVSAVNLFPLARQMLDWMEGEGTISVLVHEQRTKLGAHNNPYSYSGSSIVLMLSQTINACHDFVASGEQSEDTVDVEATRIRLLNEFLLLSARLCEVSIKQLLYCTQVPARYYEKKSLGGLLTSGCASCKDEKGKSLHDVSWVGTLACPFDLCREFDRCAMDHMALVNRLRNTLAAHSSCEDLNPRAAKESKNQLGHEVGTLLDGFAHLLTHIEKIETAILLDLGNKGEEINLLKRTSVATGDFNLNLQPGKALLQLRLTT